MSSSAYSSSRSIPVLPFLAALLSTTGGIWLALHHPLSPVGAAAGFTAWAIAAFVYPRFWLLALPACLPLLGLAPWSGWLVVEEFDLCVLASAAGYWAALCRSGGNPRATEGVGFSFSLPVFLVVFLFALSMVTAVGRGVGDAGGWSFGWYQGYMEAGNSLRLGKSLLAALVVVGLLRDALKKRGAEALIDIQQGLSLGLLGVGLATLWERLAFTDLLNFSADYRTTALFWEMHVGGAALDGFLALVLPFALWGFHTQRGGKGLLLWGGLLLLGSYVCLTTFSRGLYGAIGVALLVIIWASAMRGPAGSPGGNSWGRLARGLALVIVVAAAGTLTFRHGGYRGLLALLGVLVLSLPLGTALRASGSAFSWRKAAIGMSAAVVAIIIASVFPKGPYVAFGAAFFVCAGLLFAANGQPGRRLTGAVAAWVSAVALAALVPGYWGGPIALLEALPALAIMVVAVAWHVRAASPLWPAGGREQAEALLLASVVVSAVAFVGGGTYLNERFATVDKDIAGREQHWSLGMDMLRGNGDQLFGKGMGRFPASYYFAAPNGEHPGAVAWIGGEEKGYVRLVGGNHVNGDGEMFRFSQRIALPNPGRLAGVLKLRVEKDVLLHIEVCEKHLLYNANCGSTSLTARRSESGWQEVPFSLDATAVRGGPWYAPRLRVFSLAVVSRSGEVDLGAIRLQDATGNQVLRNSDFAAGMSHWFFSSDRHHMPWHIKNAFLNVLFEQGVVGLILFVSLLTLALWRLLGGRLRDEPMAPYLAASLLAFAVVGLFDSLLDVPRVAFLFYFLLLVSLGLRPSVGKREPGQARPGQ